MIYEINFNNQAKRIELKEISSNIYKVKIGNREKTIDARRIGETTYSIIFDEKSYEVDFEAKDNLVNIIVNSEFYQLEIWDEKKRHNIFSKSVKRDKGIFTLKAPMAGKILDILVDVGKKTTKDEGLIIMEAMKMENELRSQINGTVKDILVKKGQTVEPNCSLMIIEG